MLPRGGPNRRLIFENHHESRIAAYLVNCLVPRDPDIRITAQNRNYQQSFYQLDYGRPAFVRLPHFLPGSPAAADGWARSLFFCPRDWLSYGGSAHEAV